MDLFELRARLGPAVVAVSPVLVITLLVFRLHYKPTLTTVGVSALFALTAAVVRARGQAIQGRLFKAWGGPLIEQAIQANAAGNSVIRDRRRFLLSRLIGEALPTAADELAAPVLSRYHYAAAAKRLQIAARYRPQDAPLVTTELMHFNYARNLLAVKPLGLALAIASLGLAYWRGREDGWSAAVALSMIFSAGICATWLIIVRSSWVHRAARTYADRILDALETLAPPASPVPKHQSLWGRIRGKVHI